ncbi:MAG: hypothetical protein ACI9K2_001458 [Myxococcota bacterium]
MLGALILGAGLATAQQAPEVEWEPIALVRPRFSSGYTEGLALGFHDDRAVTHRARLGLQMRRADVEARVVAQLASGWELGARRYHFVEPRVDFYEGWGRMSAELPAKIHVSLTAGRVPITIHEGRLISNDDFGSHGQAIDGLHFRGSLGRLHLDTMTYRHPDENPNRVRGAVANWAGFVSTGPVTDLTLDLVTINDYSTPGLRTTLGPHFKLDTGRFHVQSELYSQSVTRDVLDEVVETSLLGSQTVGYTLGPERLVNVRGRFDGATGDFLGAGDGFTAPLGDSYQFFGHLGLFQDAAGSAGRGVADTALLLVVQPHARLELELDLHRLWFLDDWAVAGQEVDATVRYHFSPFSRVEVGIWVFAPSSGTAAAFDVEPIPASQYLQLEIGAPPFKD